MWWISSDLNVVSILLSFVYQEPAAQRTYCVKRISTRAWKTRWRIGLSFAGPGCRSKCMERDDKYRTRCYSTNQGCSLTGWYWKIIMNWKVMIGKFAWLWYLAANEEVTWSEFICLFRFPVFLFAVTIGIHSSLCHTIVLTPSEQACRNQTWSTAMPCWASPQTQTSVLWIWQRPCNS